MLQIKSEKTFKELYLGKKYGKLTVVGQAVGDKSSMFVQVKCDCGSVKEILLNNLVYGFSKSCGCSRELSFAKAKRMSTRVFINTPDGAKSVATIVKEYDVPYMRVYSRFLSGVTDIKELVSDVRRGGFRPQVSEPRLNGMSVTEAALFFGIKKQLVSFRLKSGWVVDKDNRWVTKKGVILTKKFLSKRKNKSYVKESRES
jgi:hypothetical protein